MLGALDQKPGADLGLFREAVIDPGVGEGMVTALRCQTDVVMMVIVRLQIKANVSECLA